MRMPNKKEGFLPETDGHRIFWRSFGAKNGQPLLILHGGPGGSMNPEWAFFNLKRWRVVMFDQRGCGASEFKNLLHKNAPDELVKDMERLRSKLGIKRWAIFGGSWGSTLALFYAQKHPKQVLGLMLRGVWLAREKDIEAFLWGVKEGFADIHGEFMGAFKKAGLREPKSAKEIINVSERVFKEGGARAKKLALAWENFESDLSFAIPKSMPKATNGNAALRGESILCHYIKNHLPGKKSILSGMKTIRHIPCEIVHGRYDAVCPVDEAFALAQVWPKAHLAIAEGSGHATFDKGMIPELFKAAKRLEKRIPKTLR